MKGASKIFWSISIGIASVIVVIVMLGALQGNIQAIIGQSDAIDATLAGARVSQMFELVSLSASHGYSLDLENEFESVLFQEGSVIFTNPGMEDVEMEIPHEVTEEFYDVNELCVKRDDEEIVIEEGDCTVGTCQTNEMIGDIETGFTCSHDNVFSRFNNSEVFHQEVDHRGVVEPYLSKDYFSCPESAEAGSSVYCHFKISYLCDKDQQDDIEVSKSFGEFSDEMSLNCTGEHEEENLVFGEHVIHEDVAYSFEAEGIHHEFDVDVSGEVNVN